MKTRIYKRGPVTMDNIIIHDNGSVSCPFSTNSYTEDEYFTIDIASLDHVLNKSWRVHNDHSSINCTHLNIRTGGNSDTTLLHRLVFENELQGLEVDHLLHFTDNRRASVEFVTKEENSRRGAAIYHRGHKNRRTA
jgi:hypothetical protein